MWWSVPAVCLLLGAGCFNDGFSNSGTLAGGGRFQLVIESSRSDVPGTHFLVDTATGDLWRLQAGGGTASWDRVASGPEDARELDIEELMQTHVEGKAPD